MYHELRNLGKNTVLVFHAAVSKILIKMGAEHELLIWAHGFRGIWAPALWTCGEAGHHDQEVRVENRCSLTGLWERERLDQHVVPPCLSPGFPWDAKSIQLAHCWPCCLFTWEDSLVRPPSLKQPKPTWVLNFPSLCNTRLPTAKGRASVAL